MTNIGCTRPGAVTPEAILAYVDGDASPDVAQHLRTCPACASEAQVYSRLQGRLGGALYRFDCPPAQALGEYELGLTSPEGRSGVARHVLDCPHCMAELLSLRTFLADDMALAPAPRGGPVEGLRRVVATLFVPAPGAGAAALRGGTDGEGATYRVEDLTITLGPGPPGPRGRASLMGLIVREDHDLEVSAGSTAHLLSATGEPVTAAIDELGSFAFDDIAPGNYGLELHLPGLIVAVEDVSVGR